MFVLLAPVLLGMVGLTVDGGLILASYRQTQNAADAAALAAAYDLYNGTLSGAHTLTTSNYAGAGSYNNMTGTTVTINIPPSTGPHAGAGNTTYAEAIVSYPYKTSFIQVLGPSSTQTITARAVAGGPLSSPVEGVMTLVQSPPGGAGGADLTVSGGATLTVDGPVVVNATTSGALAVNGSNSRVFATKVSVSGGVTGSSQVENYPSGGGASPLTANTAVNYADPYASLAAPSTSNGVVNTNYGSPSISNGSRSGLVSPNSYNSSTGVTTLNPGLYTAITISGGSVTFSPGIYVLEGGGMAISGGATVNGSGVMFYNTANNYNASTGADGSNPQFNTGIAISGGSTFNLTGINNSSSPYNGMLIFSDRSNPNSNSHNTITISGGSSTSPITGTVYAPTTNVTISGQSNFSSQFIVGTLTVTGGSAAVSIVPPAGQSNLVYLVE